MRSNEGKPFGPAHNRAFEAYIANPFNGFTRSPGKAGGGWVDNGRFYSDTMRIYIVALQSITEGGKLSEVVNFVKTHYGQEKVYLRYLGLSEIL